MEDRGVLVCKGTSSERVEQNNLRTPTKVLNGSTEEEEEKESKVGMIFKTSDDALKFYKDYGISKGFSVCMRSSRNNWSQCDLFTSYTFACSHYRSHNKKIDENVPHEKQCPNTSTMRGDCQARVNIVLDKNTIEWRITGFIKDHSHDFVSPSKKIYLKAKRKMPEVAKNMVEIFHKENLPVHKVKDILGGEVFGFNNRSCWNHLRDVRQKLDVGDAQLVSQYFHKRHLENPQFFYAIQCDGEGSAVNFFWVYARSRMSYKQFGDVVSFDTTYKTNKYNMPFAPFTGINHHFQTIQFGCALLQDETEQSFIWLFETWKEAMGGVEPVSMITDSDPAMRAAIPKVFPNTRRRRCYWHVKKNFGNNLGHLYKKKSTFKREVKKCLKYTFRIEDFEKKWDDLITKYELRDNNWLNGLYDDRMAWVPVYNRTAFFVGMNSTGRSEGINAFFKEYVKSSTNLMEFVERYEKALKKIENNEREEDFRSEQTYRLLNKESYLLQHARSIYTRKLFDKFKSNFDLVERYKSDASDNNPNIHIVKYKVGVEEHWLVKFDPQTMQGSCECNFFEFDGIPCAHLLKVFSKLDMVKIPEYFIKSRWLKGANKYQMTDKERLVSQRQANVMRLSQLCHEATQLACVASETNEGYKMYLDGIRGLAKRISEIDINASVNESRSLTNEYQSSECPPTIKNARLSKKVSEVDMSTSANEPRPDKTFVQEPESGKHPPVIKNPHLSKTKGMKDTTTNKKRKSAQDARYKHPMEIKIGRTPRKCRGCGELVFHDVRNCPSPWKLAAEKTDSDADENAELGM